MFLKAANSDTENGFTVYRYCNWKLCLTWGGGIKISPPPLEKRKSLSG